MAVSFFAESMAGAGAIAGAAVVSVVGVSSFVLHAASASTAATRARRFIYILLEGDDQRCHGPRTRYQDRGRNLRSRSLVSRPGMFSKCKDSNVFPPTLRADARFVPLVTNRRDFRSRKRARMVRRPTLDAPDVSP